MKTAKMRRLLCTLLAPLVLLAGHGAQAQITERDVTRQRVTLDPARGYIFMRTPGRLAGTFLRVPDEEALQAYRERRAAALAAEMEDYQRRLQGWQRRQEIGSLRRNDERPVEPTEATLAFPSFTAQTAQSFGPEYVYAEDEASPLRYSYLTVVPPGRYVWYGPVFFDAQMGHSGACYCMGSVMFDVEAGKVTDLGNYLTAAPQFENQPAVVFDQFRGMGGWNGFAIVIPDHSSAVSFGLPASLAAWPSRRTEFQAVGKMNNVFGVRITRLAPIPGVLGYDRDRVMDLRTGAELPPFPVF